MTEFISSMKVLIIKNRGLTVGILLVTLQTIYSLITTCNIISLGTKKHEIMGKYSTYKVSKVCVLFKYYVVP